MYCNYILKYCDSLMKFNVHFFVISGRVSVQVNQQVASSVVMVTVPDNVAFLYEKGYRQLLKSTFSCLLHLNGDKLRI